ncbi:MAG: VOC family protein [Pseudomonadota bacterium]
MIKIDGIGGLFFRARDPKKLAAWYEEVFGIPQVADDYETPAWQQQAGTTVFAPFAKNTDYFPKSQTWMLNLRIADMDAALAELGARGIAITYGPETFPNGRFAHIADPEGNPIELWEPGGTYA